MEDPVEHFEKCATLTIQNANYIILVEIDGWYQELIWRWKLMIVAFNVIKITHLNVEAIETCWSEKDHDCT